MPDDTIRSVMVDENQPVANLMVIICTKLGQYQAPIGPVPAGRRRWRQSDFVLWPPH